MEKGKYLSTLMRWQAPVYQQAYLRRYGSRCFLKAPSYPICTRGKIDCKGVQAAAYYVRLNKQKSLTRKVNRLKHSCKHIKKTHTIK